MLEQLVAEYEIRDGELTSSVPVTNERDLIISMLAYIKQDVGGERFVASADALSTFAARFPEAHKSGRYTSVRAALAMSRLGVPSAAPRQHQRLHAPLAPRRATTSPALAKTPSIRTSSCSTSRTSESGSVMSTCTPLPEQADLRQRPSQRGLVLSDAAGLHASRRRHLPDLWIQLDA